MSSIKLLKINDIITKLNETKGDYLIPIGSDIEGNLVVESLLEYPRIFIEGPAGSGKSILLQTILTSLSARFIPTDVRFVLIDRGAMTLYPFRRSKNLLCPLASDEDVLVRLQELVETMDDRYCFCSEESVSNFEELNEKLRNRGDLTLPYIVVAIDNLDALTEISRNCYRDIYRLVAKGRAAGIITIITNRTHDSIKEIKQIYDAGAALIHINMEKIANPLENSLNYLISYKKVRKVDPVKNLRPCLLIENEFKNIIR